MNRILLALLSLSFLIAHEARAFAFECPALSSFDETAKECDDNDTIAEAGVLCLERLKELVASEAKIAAGKMTKSNEQHVGDDVNKQTNAFSGTVADLGIAIASYADLLRAAEAAKKAAFAYEKNIYLPEDFEIAENLPGGIEEFLEDFPCFTENRETLQWVGEDIDFIIEKLKNNKAEMEKLLAKTKSRGTTLDDTKGAGGTKVLKSTGAGKAAKSEKKIHKKKESTVTGKIKNEQLPDPSPAPKK